MSRHVVNARSRTFNALMSSPKPNLSLGMSCGPPSFFTDPPGVLSPDLSLFASAFGLLWFSAEAPFMIAPMLGIVLAPFVPLAWVGAASAASWSWARAPGVDVRE